MTGGYTTHTCECGHSWTDNVTPVGEHAYQYKHSETEHYRECTLCHEIAGRGMHKLGEWKTVSKAGYTFTGEKQRICRDCGYVIREEISMLKIPENKAVITIPDYPLETESEAAKSEVPSDTAQGGSSSDEQANILSDTAENPAQKITKEILTKGDDNIVPALPTLPPTEDGNEFKGWVSKTTGEPVKKGDKLTGNIEIEPVWKDCGEDHHKDENADNHCDDCGYILVRKTVQAVNPPETDSSESDSGIPVYVIAVLSIFGGIVAVCVIVIITTLTKKKKT